MALTVREVVQLKELKELKVVAGQKGLDNNVRWVHLGEEVNIADWLKGGELLLTCGHGIKNNKARQEYFIKDLSENNLSGLGIELGYYFNEIPENMRILADKINFPLIEIPFGMPFIKITETVLKILVNQSSFENTEIKEFNQEFNENLNYLNAEQKLMEEVKLGNRKQAEKLLTKILIGISNSNLDKELIKTKYIEIIVCLSRVAAECGISEKTVLVMNNKIINEIRNKENSIKSIIRFAKKIIYFIRKDNNTKYLDIVQKTKEFIWNNSSKKINLNHISSYVNFSSSHLSKIFKEIVGMSIMEYANQVRLRKAKEKLKTTDLSLSEIAEYVGYYDASYFTKSFKDEYGITPGKYRENSKNKIEQINISTNHIPF